MKFIGEECIVCKKQFSEYNDIVVCEICGTPYHRECYNQIGKCINTEYHENGWTFSQKHSKPKEIIEQNTVKQDRYKFVEEKNDGFNNSTIDDNYNRMISVSNDILNQVNINPEEEYSGVTLLEFYLYTKSLFTTKKFYTTVTNKSKNSFNIWAFLFPEYYMASKNMYVPAVLTFLINFILTIPLLIWNYPQYMNDQMSLIVATTEFKIIANLSLVLSAVFRLFIGYKFLPFYFKECIKDINEIKHKIQANKQSYNELLKKLISVRSGINFLAVLIVFICSEILISYFYFILKLLLMYLGG